MITKPILKVFFLKNISLHYDFKGHPLSMSYGDDNQESVLDIACCTKSDFFEGSTDIIPEQVVWKEWKGRKIPFCFDSLGEKEIMSYENGKVRIHYDIIASTFYFLSGWSERVNKGDDMLGRSPYKGSIIEKLGIWDLPVVNYYYDIFIEALDLLGIREVNVKSPAGGASFSVLLTHDIDTCTTGWAVEAWNTLRRKELANGIKILFQRLLGRDPWFNFREIHEIEKRFGAVSTWFFLARKGSNGPWKNADYKVGSKKIRGEMAFLEGEGHEIGVHGSFGTHTDSGKMSEDIKRIGYEIVGNRFHFLMFDNDQSISILENNKLKYDCTLGFANHIGFRRAVCSPFYLFNFSESQISEMLEFPLLVMDTTLDHARYMGLTPDQAMEPILNLIREVEKFNGVFTLLWHNTYFTDFKYRGWGAVYQQILSACKQQNAWMTSGSALYTHYVKPGIKL